MVTRRNGVLIKDKMELTKDDIDIIAGGPPAPASPTSGVQKSSVCCEMGDLKTGLGVIKTLTNSVIPLSKTSKRLFLEFVKYVEHFEPRWFIMENVPGMLTSKIEANGGVLKIVDVVKKAFRNIDISVRLNLFGQTTTAFKREGVIFLGWKNEKDKITHPARSIKDITSVQAIDDLSLMGQDGGEFATYGGRMSDTPNRYRKDMRYGVYKKAKRRDPRTEKIPTGKEALMPCWTQS